MVPARNSELTAPDFRSLLSSIYPSFHFQREYQHHFPPNSRVDAGRQARSRQQSARTTPAPVAPPRASSQQAAGLEGSSHQQVHAVKTLPPQPQMFSLSALNAAADRPHSLNASMREPTAAMRMEPNPVRCKDTSDGDEEEEQEEPPPVPATRVAHTWDGDAHSISDFMYWASVVGQHPTWYVGKVMRVLIWHKKGFTHDAKLGTSRHIRSGTLTEEGYSAGIWLHISSAR
eukprot:6103288-Pleurochrysis_carterae.AAC.5